MLESTFFFVSLVLCSYLQGHPGAGLGISVQTLASYALRWLSDEVKHKSNKDLATKEWGQEICEVPKQDNVTDCGVFMLA
jgi:Ulp1 family protease